MFDLCVFGVSAMVVIGFLHCAFHGSFLTGIADVAGGLSYSVYLGAKALRRPCYLTTDDAGIGITTSTGSTAIAWRDITRARFRGSYCEFLMGPWDAEEFNLIGYSREHMNGFKELVVREAKLQPHAWKRNVFVRRASSLDGYDSGIPLAAPGELPESFTDHPQLAD